MTHSFVPPRTALALRRCAYFAHLWIGLILGLYFVLMGLTGCLLLFENELDAGMNRPLFTVRSPAGVTARPLDDLAAAVMRRHPGATVSVITLPSAPDQSLRIGFSPPGRTDGARDAASPRGGRAVRMEAFINPYTGAFLGERPAGGAFFPQVLRLHRQFLLADVGQALNRYGVLFLIVLLASGLWLWWPSARGFAQHLRQRTTIQRGARGRRLLFDLHNTIGFYSSLLLFVIALTGASYFWKPQTIAVVSTLTGTPMVAQEDGPGGPSPRGRDRGGDGGREGRTGTQSASYATVLASAQKVFPKLPPIQISHGRGGRGGLRVTKAAPAAHGVRPRLITININERDGSISGADFPDASPFGLRVMNWLMPIHEGQWGYGLLYYPVKVLHLLAGLSPLALFVTGLLMYMHKRRGQIENRRRRQARPVKKVPTREAVSAQG